MAKQGQKAYKTVTIKNDLGLHARSAAQIAAIARSAAGNVWIMKDGEKADASSIIDVLTLVCEKGTKITIMIEDSADVDTLNAIADLVDSGFGE
jgi:phosphotransferase system HPr (HPr) family protein